MRVVRRLSESASGDGDGSVVVVVWVELNGAVLREGYGCRDGGARARG